MNGMGHVRGSNLRDAVAFVRQSYGETGVDRVFRALPAEARKIFDGPIRDAGWYPVTSLQEYLVTARAVLDPLSSDFPRRQGRFAALSQKAGPLGKMVSSPALRMRLASLVFRMYYDVGSLEVVGRTPEEARARIHDFPATPELCERFLGIWEGMATSPTETAHAEEHACVRRGDAYCEISVRRTKRA
jgi:hypothetical protein